jgi:hypothetical protein
LAIGAISAPNRADGGGQDEAQRDDAPHVHADEFGRQPIVGGGKHALADSSALEEPGQGRDDGECGRNDPDALGQKRCPGKMDGPIAGEGRQCARAFAEGDLNETPQHHRGGDGDDDECRDVRVARRRDCKLGDQVADRCSRDDRSGNGDNERHAGRCERRGDHAAEHDELALGEIDHVGGVVDDRQAQRRQRVSRADGQAGDEILQKLGHREGHSSIGDEARSRGPRPRRVRHSISFHLPS